MGIQADLFLKSYLTEDEKRELRYYEEEAIDKTISLVKDGQNPLVIMATGTGKTIVGASSLHKLTEGNKKKALWLAHRDNLLEAAMKEISSWTGVVPHKEKADEYALLRSQFVCGSVQTMKSDQRLHRFPADHFSYGLIDEAHHTTADSYMHIMDYFKIPTIGLTATPDRNDDRHLNQFYTAISYEYPLHKAIEEKFLVPIKGFKVTNFDMDMSELRISRGDYTKSSLEKLFITHINPIVSSIIEQSSNLKTLCFFPSVESCRLISTALRDAGIKSDWVAGTRSQAENDKAFYDFHVGNISHLVSCDLVLEGYNEPSIQAIVLGRPTSSRILFSQIVGRGTRLFPGKEFLKLIEFTYTSSKLRLVSPFELFSTKGYGENVQNVAEARYSDTEGVDYLDALKSAADDYYSIKGITDRLFKRQKGLEFTYFDPLALGDLLGVDLTGEFDITYNGHKLTGRITNKQLSYLERYGIDHSSGIDKAQASMLISSLREKGYQPYSGNISQNQKSFLLRRGIDGSNMKKAQASVLITEIIKKEGK